MTYCDNTHISEADGYAPTNTMVAHGVGDTDGVVYMEHAANSGGGSRPPAVPTSFKP